MWLWNKNLIIAVIILLAVIAIATLESPTHAALFGSEYEKLIRESLKNVHSEKQDITHFTQIGITSHHLPTAVNFIANFYKTLANSQGSRETFVIIGPDHLEKCDAKASTTKISYQTPFGQLSTDDEIIDQLIEEDVLIDDKCFEGEHSIGVQAVFIKYLFPTAKIVPITFSATTEDSRLHQIADVLIRYKNRITVVVSVDFSHYQTYDVASKLDKESEEMIRSMNAQAISLKHVDSPPSVRFAILLAQKLSLKDALILGRANSYDFVGEFENTTGYINVIFPDYTKTKDVTTLMFVGDIMLSRSVGKKMERLNNFRWPFLKVAPYLKKADLLFGNLEGPISDKGRNIGSIYSFKANPKAVEGLKLAGFDVLSVANNHIGDWGRVAMEDTLKILKQNNIGYTGGGFSEKEAHSAKVEEVKGVRFGFLGYTELGPRYIEARINQSGIAFINKEKVLWDVREARKKSDFVIVSLHFGDEYQTKSNTRQKDIAHAAIDAGASLVIGHHPHVVQEIEKYHGGYIAYSLGNFIFDQTFSKETMKGLLLEITLKGKEIINVKEVKINILKNYQATF